MRKLSTIATAVLLASSMNVFAADAPQSGKACQKEKAACCKVKGDKKPDCCKDASCDKQSANHAKCEKHEHHAKG